MPPVMFAALVLAAEPFPPSGGASWQWVPIAGSKCITGASTGVHLRYSKHAQPSDGTRLAIYLHGGGACFNAFTCATASKSEHPSAPGPGGIFSVDDERNPLRYFHWLSVPYCTGDVHVGDKVKTVALSKRYFSGHTNLELILARAKATWPNVTELVLTGESAGGFGAFANFPFVRGHWEAAHAVMLDDSGPVLDDMTLAPCLQASWRAMWDLNKILPDGCPCKSDGGNMSSGWQWFRQQYPRDSLGLISSAHDEVISLFFSFGEAGAPHCPTSIPRVYDKIQGGLERLAAQRIPLFVLPGAQHTHTGDKPSFYSASSDGVLLYEWVTQLLDPDRPDPSPVLPAQALVELEAPVVDARLTWAKYASSLSANATAEAARGL